MIYQDMIVGKRPYYVAYGKAQAYKEHRHPELEINLCVKGSYELQLDKTKYTMSKNQLAIIAPMISHSRTVPEDSDSLSFSIEISPVLLLEFFEPFSNAVFPSPVISLSDCNRKLSNLIYETYKLCQNRTGMTELLINGNLYKICYYIYEEFIQQTTHVQRPEHFRDIEKVEEAIALIHSHYAEPLTLKYIASHVRYSEGHFCRIFKKITGITFHNALNRCRIKNACCLLKETTRSVSDIALQVGFADAKTFCTAFKQYTGYTPREFRKDDSLSLRNFHL